MTEPRGANLRLVEREFLYHEAPFLECHAVTLAETTAGRVAAWFGGTREGHQDVGIWFSRLTGSDRSVPVEVATGVQGSGERLPCWNPVLFEPFAGPLLLFYKVGPDPRSWWGMTTASEDGGLTWSAPERLPAGILGPIKNKPVQLESSRLVSPVSDEADGWSVCFELSDDLGRNWRRTPPVADEGGFSAIQPTLLVHRGGRLQALCRSRRNVVVETHSDDDGETWSPLAATQLPNPNSGIDAVTLADGRHLLVYNPTTVPAGRWGGPRTPLSVALSEDGVIWERALDLEDDEGEYSYPAVIQSSEGRIHLAYTWRRRRIRHAVLEVL